MNRITNYNTKGDNGKDKILEKKNEEKALDRRQARHRKFARELVKEKDAGLSNGLPNLQIHSTSVHFLCLYSCHSSMLTTLNLLIPSNWE